MLQGTPGSPPAQALALGVGDGSGSRSGASAAPEQLRPSSTRPDWDPSSDLTPGGKADESLVC